MVRQRTDGKTTMRAYVLEGFDVPPKMIDTPTPQIGASDILVRVRGVVGQPS
jgi:D-arabinose 1-dehydrogenase-like Zn-dependent alcohol dehydrogenase